MAEYNPQTGKYYFYQSDQINSTRIITDESGQVVYSAAHGPYGDVQKLWVNAFSPNPKFSGKEREGYTEMDYFGARYYDTLTRRFLSTDPIINKDRALTNPQAWNLYAYCGNNPITYLDPDGRSYKHIRLNGKIRVWTPKDNLNYYLGIVLEGVATCLSFGGSSGTKIAKRVPGFLKSLWIRIRSFGPMRRLRNALKLGTRGSSSRIRQLKGSWDDAVELYEKISKGGKTIKGTSYPGVVKEFGNGARVSLRRMKGKPPTIDIKIPGKKGNFKIKFIE